MKKLKFPLVFLIGIFLELLATTKFAPVREQIDWRVSKVMADIKYAISPPEDVVFVPRLKSIPETGDEIPLPTWTAGGPPVHERTATCAVASASD